MQANQSQLIKLWPLCPHQTTRMNLQKTKKSGKIETKWWYSKNLETYLHVLLSNCLVPGCCTFSRLKNLLPKPFSIHQSSPSLYMFQVPLFYASSSRPLSCFPFSLMPHLFFSFSPYIRISLSNSICSRESTFLSSISLTFSKIRMLISSHAGSSLSICMQPH